MISYRLFSTFLPVTSMLIASMAVVSLCTGEKPGSGTRTEGQSQDSAGSNKSGRSGPIWSSQDLRKAVEQIDASNSAKLAPQDVPPASLRDVSALLEKQYSTAQLHELAASFASVPSKLKDWSNCQCLLRESLLGLFLKNGDHDGLVTLLALHCFQQVYFETDIEVFIVLHGEKLNDPILVLGDAYKKSTSSDVRRDIAEAVRRGFSGSGITGRDDSELVSNAMAWYGVTVTYNVISWNYKLTANFSLSVWNFDPYWGPDELKGTQANYLAYYGTQYPRNDLKYTWYDYKKALFTNPAVKEAPFDDTGTLLPNGPNTRQSIYWLRSPTTPPHSWMSVGTPVTDTDTWTLSWNRSKPGTVSYSYTTTGYK
jgi:hypothetical protein